MCYLLVQAGVEGCVPVVGGGVVGGGQGHHVRVLVVPWQPLRYLGWGYFGAVHCGLTGGWVQNLKAAYLPYFLQCAMVGSAIG